MTDLYSPHFLPYGLSPQESKMAHELLSSLARLPHYVEDFAAAVQLFDVAENEIRETYAERSKLPDYGIPSSPEHLARMRLLQRWQLIAGRDGAITIFNYGKTLQSARTLLFSACPTWRALAPQDKVDDSFSLWEANFPRFVAIRHAVAHAGEFAQPGKREEHKMTGKPDLDFLGTEGDINLYMSGNLNGRTFLSTFNEKIVGYEVSMKTVETLVEITTTFFSVFDPIKAAAQEAHMRDWRSRQR